MSAPAIDIARSAPPAALSSMLRLAAAGTGRSYAELVREFLSLSCGPGALSFDDYIAHGLYDSQRYGGADKRHFVGQRGLDKIWRRANFREELYGLMQNKIAMRAVLEAHGFPIIERQALFSAKAGFRSPKLLRDFGELLAFLRDPARYPLFGKPTEGQQSLGSISLAAYDAQSDELLGTLGARFAAETFAREIETHFSAGYLFQRRIAPHPETQRLCGDRLGTVRVVTLLRESGPAIFGACEKIPAGSNCADNYWRDGNLLVELDAATGLRGRAVSGKGAGLRDHTRHPDSGGQIAGTPVPNWPRVRELALQGALLFDRIALIGWDIAPVEGGAVIVEANVTPDLTLLQFASRRGVLNEEFCAFLAERDAARKLWQRRVRRERLADCQPAWMAH